MSPLQLALQFALLAFSLTGLSLLLWRGKTWDRAAAGVVLIALTLSYAIDNASHQGFEFGVILIDAAAFIALWLIAEQAGRWWIVMTAALHLVSSLVYVAPFLTATSLAWAAMTLIWVLWLVTSLTFFFGVWEIEAARRFALGGRYGSTLDDGGGPRAAPSME
ncbi:hypothetical protein [Brevundimonas naejangsanensis]|uniref:hypothetical protein n=1 Tax=Brevundimonas naejangsanensis TaxID=588932 RepID=UPI0026EBBD03|nr:hypothetical protein [Brevundimonas naejangsanensis]